VLTKEWQYDLETFSRLTSIEDMPRKYYLRYLQLPRRSRVRNYSAIVLLARTNLPNLIVRGTLDIQDYDDGDMQCRRMFCRHTVWDDLRGVCHLFLSDHTCASLDYDFSPCRLAGRFHVQTLYAGMNAILHPRFRSHITITASEASRLHYTVHPQAAGAAAVGGTNGVERELDIADVQILDIEA
jgi:hypothetical protein